MIGPEELSVLIDLIYEAALDGELWPGVLIKLADAMGAAQISMPSFDCRTNIFTTIAPRFDPDLLASYKEYWASRDPVFGRTTFRPAGEIYTLDSLMPREEFSATPAFNEWWRPAKCGLAAIGANLVAEDQFSASLCIHNAPDKDFLTASQTRVFAATLRHIVRAVRINRQLWKLELKHLAPPERFENLPQGCFAGRRLSESGYRECRREDDARRRRWNTSARWASRRRRRPGHLTKADRLMRAKVVALAVPAANSQCHASPPSPLHVAVTPLRSTTRLAEVPWTGVGAPVAMVMVRDPEFDRRRLDKSAPPVRADRRGDRARRRDFEWQWPQGSRAATRRLRCDGQNATISILRRREPIGRPSSSVSCSMPPKRKKWTGGTKSASRRAAVQANRGQSQRSRRANFNQAITCPGIQAPGGSRQGILVAPGSASGRPFVLKVVDNGSVWD